MDKQTMIDKLNEDLASELAAIIQYTTYAAKATGPYRPQLTQFYLAEVPDELGHAQYLANKIVALGGEPTTVAGKVKAAHSNREMLEAVLAAEKEATAGYTQRQKKPKNWATKAWPFSWKTWSAMKAVTRKKSNAFSWTGHSKPAPDRVSNSDPSALLRAGLFFCVDSQFVNVPKKNGIS